ncbi:MAG: division/cell wall cluster transcriptional repressor MraZ [Terracidiphilus sp.]|jgi:MraZ protein
MEAFRGNHPAKVEDGGRLKLPSPFKALLDEAGVTQLYITSEDGLKAQIWPLPTWEKREALLAEASTMDDAVESYLTVTSYYGQQVEMDKQARVTLPLILRESANLDGQVAILGKLHYLEVQNLKTLQESLPGKAITAERRQSLKVTLKPHSNNGSN